MLSASPFSDTLDLFPSPPFQMQQPQPPLLSIQPVVTISLGEEYTDDMLPRRSYMSFSNEEDEEDDDDDSDESMDSPISESPSSSPRSLHAPLWQAEHARLLRIQNAVLDNERAARYREMRLESEVARIKDDLAKLKQSQSRWRPSQPSMILFYLFSTGYSNIVHFRWRAP